jgi:intraflagellar transport protein 52
VRVANGEAKQQQKQGKYAKRYKDTNDELQNRDENGGLKFVYPYGATLNVRKPAHPLLSSGPISFPPNRPIAAIYTSSKKGKLFVIGSMKFFEDTFFENEDNQKIQEAVFKWLLNGDGEAEFEAHVQEEPEISEYQHVPDITALADRLRSCLQESDDLPKDFTTLFHTNLYKFDTDLVPQAIELFKTLNVVHQPLTLIPPQFETPMPQLQAATFLPCIKDLPPPSLDLYDLDEQFASERIKMAQLTNKCTDEDVEYYIKECGDILGVAQFIENPDDPKAILHYIFQEIVKYKSSNLS